MSGLDLLGADTPDTLARRRPLLSGSAVALGGGLVGIALSRAHPVLGFLAGSALANNAHAVACGERSPSEAARRVARHATAHVAALAIENHPAIAYVFTTAAFELVLSGNENNVLS